MDLWELPITASALLSILILGNIVPLGVIAGIYWYMTKGGRLSVHPRPIRHPSPIRLVRRTDRAA